MNLIKKYAVLIGMAVALLLLLMATVYYPGGSQLNINSVGYDWRNNYLSNLFSPTAMNGMPNTATYFAVPGMLFLSLSFALFFISFSRRIPSKSAARVIRISGAGSMVFAFLAVTPWHDTVITIAVTMVLVSIFYITVFIYKSRLFFFKIHSTACLLILYLSNYVYYTRSFLEYLPVIQKVVLLLTVTWAVGLQYFSKTSDFQKGKN